MNSICLFEAGSTKTTLLIDTGGVVTVHELPGFNPNRYSPDFEKAFSTIDVPNDAQVIFYGSGLSSDTNKEIVQKMLATKFTHKAEINHDQIGAARSVWGDQPGLVGIMGTGAFAAWYDGEKLVDRKGGHGYLIDDIGGGFELGKVILSAWLNDDLPTEMSNTIAAFVKSDQAGFTTTFYKNPDLQLVAGIATIALQFSNHAAVKPLLIEYFNTYFSRHIHPVIKKHPQSPLGLVGGIAVAFENIIRLSTARLGISELVLVANPAMKLLEYHRNKKG